jgi:hypothetical protein
VHHLQGEAERVKSADLLTLLRGFHAEALTQRARHEASALRVGDYDFNNTYQYVLNREDAHLAWLRDAIESIGGSVAGVQADAAPPARAGQETGAAIAADDARAMHALIDEWKGKLGEVTHARHRRMLDVILGEMREHERFFEQASAGRTDLLGRRTGGPRRAGRVLATRWVE